MAERIQENFFFEQKNDDEKNNLKYPLDVISNEIEAAEIDIKLSRKEIIDISKICNEGGYGNTVDFVKKYANKSGFKRIVISPFSMNFYAVPLHKENSCFIPSGYIPRLKNLQKIMPNIAEYGTQTTIMHEREHGRAGALTAYGGKVDEKSDGKIKGFDIESLTNLQKINKMTENGGGKAGKDFAAEIAVKEFVYLEILKNGAEILESENIEKIAIDYFKHNYLFGENDESLEKYKNSSSNYLNSVIDYKREGKLNNFYDLFLEEFRKIKNEVLEKYNQFMQKNNIPDFYYREDCECENLRIKIINHLNQEKII